MLNFHQSLPFLNWLFPSTLSCKNFLQDFPARLSHKIFLKDFPTRFSCKNFPQDFPTRISCQIFLQDFPELDPDWLAPHHPIRNAKFPPITAFLKLAFSPPPCPARISCKIFPQDFPTRISRKIFLQDFPELDPDWLAPHHPIPNAKFPPITAFLKLAFYPPPCPTRIFPQEFPARFSHKNFPKDFPTRFSHKIFPQDFPELDPDWLAPHHPIPNAKFPPITVLLNTYHKRSKVSPPPFPQILWEHQINE